MMERLRLSLVALSVATIACTIFIGGPPLPEPPVAESPDALATLQSEVEAAMLGSLQDGSLQLSFTQEQLTAFLRDRLGEQSEPILTDPQIVLGQQEMLLYGRARSWIFEANVVISSRFQLDASGQPQILITSAQMGPFPMPTALQDALAAVLDEIFTGYVGPAALGFRLESIDISNGVMMITGRLR